MLLTAILLVSIYAQIDYEVEKQTKYYPSVAVDVDKLNEKPAEYFSLPNPDQFVLQAIQTESYVDTGSLNGTQIDQLIMQHGTNNIEYKGSYYRVQIAAVDRFPPYLLQAGICYVGIIISISAVVILFIFRIRRIVKTPKIQ